MGSAVNNSNSGALLAGKGLDWLDRLASKVPLLGVGSTVSGAAREVQQRQAQSIAKALVQTPAKDSHRPMGVTLGALLTAGEADGR